MAMMGVCVALLLAGLVFGIRWCTLPFTSPPLVEDPGPGEVARRFVWYCSLLILGGIASGVSVMGAGGRLAMRLLAVTAGDEAQGRITEADEVVGEITVDGTVGFIVFVGVFTGLIVAAIYLLIRRLLPPAWLGGLVFGAALLVVLGTVADPLRDENPDFDIVGPGWVAVVVFTAMALALGVVLAAFTARLSTWLPLPSRERGVLLRYLPVAVVAVFALSITAGLVVLGALVVVATRWLPLHRWVRSPIFVRIGRIILVAVVAVSLPGALLSIADIVSR